MFVRAYVLSVILAVCSPALSQQASPTLQGSFIAHAGPATYRGKWSARISSRAPNAAAGSWILLNDKNDIVLQGTWSAHKSGAGWRGTWRAHVLRGQAYSGTWTASEPGLGGKTFADMLKAATKGGASGTWRSNGYGGDWRLAPAP